MDPGFEFLDAPFPMVALYHGLQQPDEARLDLARELLAEPVVVAEAFSRTIEALSPYDNDEAFYPTRREHQPNTDLSSTKDLALRLAPRGTRHRVHGADQLGLPPDALDFVHLDRELLLTRTTSARRNPGIALPDHALRLDVLLASTDGTPIVGEVKIKRDRDLTYALIHSLACVALLATDHQRKRLSAHYDELVSPTEPRGV